MAGRRSISTPLLRQRSSASVREWTAFAVLLVAYFSVFLFWELTNQFGAAISGGGADLLTNSLLLSATWKTGQIQGEYIRAGPPVAFGALLQLLTGPGNPVPLLPYFLFFLPGLIAVFVLARNLAGRWAGVLAAGAALTTDLFSYWSINPDHSDSPVSGLILASAAALVVGRSGSKRWPLAAGLLYGVALATHYYQLLFLPSIVCVIALRTPAEAMSRRARRILGQAGFFAVGGLVPVALSGDLLLAQLSRRVGDISRELKTETIGFSALWLELSQDLSWSAFWPLSWMRADGPPHAAFLLMLALAGVTIWIARRSPARRRLLLALSFLAVSAVVPLLVLYAQGAHPQLPLLCLLVAASAGLAWILRRICRPLLPLLAVLFAAGMTVSLGHQWSKPGGSGPVRRMLWKALEIPEPRRTRIACPDASCRDLLEGMDRVRKLVGRRGTGAGWEVRGICTAGPPRLSCAPGVTPRFPMDFWCLSRKGPNALSPRWMVGMIRDRWPHLRKNETSRVLILRTVREAALGRPEQRCRWLMGIQRSAEDVGGRIGRLHRSVRDGLRRWRRLQGARTVELVSRFGIGSGWELRLWTSVRRKQ